MTDILNIIGLTLLHFLWQGALVALITAVALWWLRREPPQSRYLILITALAAMLVFPVLTIVRASRVPAPAAADVWGAAVAAAPPLSASSPSTPPVPGNTASATLERVLRLTALAWMACVLGLCAQLAGGCWRISAIARGEPSRWQEAANGLAGRLGLRRPVHVVDSALARTPFLIGWLRPTIVLPLACLAHLSPSQVETILLHELAHVRRHDFAVNLVQTLVEILFFYHPATWWISRRLKDERELCCDEMVVSVCGNPEVYASALIELAARDLGSQADAMAVAAAGGPLLSRIQHLLLPRDRRPPRRGRTVTVLLLLLSALVAAPRFMPSTRAAQTAPEPAPSWRFGPRDFNRLLGFELFPGPINPLGDPSTVAWRVTITYPSGEMVMHGFGARSLVRLAYGVPRAHVVIPSWADRESLDLSIAADHLPATEEIPELIRGHLEKHLGLESHLGATEVPVYALVVSDRGLGSQLRPSTDDCSVGVMRDFRAQPLCGINSQRARIMFRKVTLAALANHLSHEPFLDREIVDRTGLSGDYDGELNIGFPPATIMTSRHPALRPFLQPIGFSSIFKTLTDQLGLTLEPATAQRDLLVVDAISKPN